MDEVHALSVGGIGCDRVGSRPKGRTVMSLDRSLKTKGKLEMKRSVLNRAERIVKLQAENRFDPKKDSALGLPKTLSPKA